MIDFKTLRKQNLNKNDLLEVIELLYNKTIQETTQNIKINEYVNKCTQVENGVFYLDLINEPINEVEILIVSSCGNIVITPAQIRKVEKNVVYIESFKIKTDTSFFITYKY